MITIPRKKCQQCIHCDGLTCYLSEHSCSNMSRFQQIDIKNYIHWVQQQYQACTNHELMNEYRIALQDNDGKSLDSIIRRTIIRMVCEAKDVTINTDDMKTICDDEKSYKYHKRFIQRILGEL